MPSPRHFLRHFVPFTGYPYRGAPAACNLCGCRDTVTVAGTDRRLKTLTSVACVQCGLIRIDPMPTADELSAYYATAYRADYQLAFSGGPPRHHRLRATREAARRAALLAPKLVAGTRVLDFGCGSGEFLAACRARGCDVVGIEPGRDYADFAARTHGVDVLAEADDARFPHGHFDVISTHHVLEHLRDPADILARLSAWLKLDGVLYAAVPDMAATAKPPHERFHFAHVHGFVRETFDLLAARAGLVPHEDYGREDTTVVYRKGDTAGDLAGDAVSRQRAVPGLAARLARELKPMSPGLFLASGAWLWPAMRRNAKAVRDGLARR